MTPYNTGKVQIGIAFDHRAMPKVDYRWQAVLLSKAPAKPGFWQRLLFWSAK